VSSQSLNTASAIHGFREERFYFEVCFTQYKHVYIPVALHVIYRHTKTTNTVSFRAIKRQLASEIL